MKILLPRRPAHAYHEYLDPIFPPRSKASAASRHSLASTDSESPATELESFAGFTDEASLGFDDLDSLDFPQSNDRRSLAERYREARQKRRPSMTERLERLSSSLSMSSASLANFAGFSKPAEDRGLGYHETMAPGSDEEVDDSLDDRLSSCTCGKQPCRVEMPFAFRALSRVGYSHVEQNDISDLLVLETKKPQWSQELQAWTLNFEGRGALKGNWGNGGEDGAPV
eukprot:scaffold441_cov241-Pinguiococcus_pyrenoidosus.AAC.3